MNGEEDSCMCLLPDGRNVELCSQEGSDAFLQTQERFNFFTANIKVCNMIRKNARKSRRSLTESEKRHLTGIHFQIDCFARYGSPKVFNERVPDKEVEYWMDHVMSELKKKAKDPSWQRTGVLEQHDAFLINPCVSMFLRDAPAELAFEKGFFKVLSDFVQALKAPLLPCADVAETICLLTTNTFIHLIFRSDPWTPEKIFKKLESCGMLEQFIRCSTIPQAYDAFDFPPGLWKFYEELIECPYFIRKKFKSGEPCGDVVRAILDGTDGCKEKRVPVIEKLEAIVMYANVMQTNESIPGERKTLKMCRKCNKAEISAEFQKKLMLCSKCQNVYYCSRECQVADWKAHKKECKTGGKSTTKNSDALQQVVWNFSMKHYISIMAKIVEFCDDSGLTKSEVLLELDFLPDNSGVAPAFKDPPGFMIKESRGYFEGTRPNEPDWFYRDGSSEDESTIPPAMVGLKDHYNRMTQNHVLCLARHPGSVCTYRLQGVVQQEEKQMETQMFGEEAFRAFQSAIHDDDYGPLSNIFHEIQVRSIRRGLGSMPSDAEMDRVRMMLNAMGGDFPLHRKKLSREWLYQRRVLLIALAAVIIHLWVYFLHY